MDEVKTRGGHMVSARTMAIVVGTIVVLGLLGFLSVRLLAGRGLGLWRIASVARASLNSRSTVSQSHGDFTNVFFLHHSVGRNLIDQGDVRNRFTKAGFRFWDQGYNWEEVRRPDGSHAGYSYVVPDENTDPDGLAEIFAQRVYGLPLNTFSGLLQHEVIAFKSCFPVSGILSDEQLAAHKSDYLSMREVMDQHNDRLFIVVTPPPLNPADTDKAAAARARAFANWLKSDEFLRGHPNIVTFDLFDRLAEGDAQAADSNMLRQDYREGADSHPTRIANETIGPQFVDFVIDAIDQYRQTRPQY